MKRINNLLANSKYSGFKKPLEAAGVCDAARELSNGRYDVISFSSGVLCLSVSSSGAAANLQAESDQIIGKINKELGKDIVKRLRYKIQ